MSTAVQTGQIVELIFMPNDPDPIKPGDRGVVTYVTAFSTGGWQIGVAWKSGRTLRLVPGDQFKVVE